MISWRCHICGKERPDDKISVYTKSLIINGAELGSQNIRYCNDNDECFEKAKIYNFVGGTPR